MFILPLGVAQNSDSKSYQGGATGISADYSYTKLLCQLNHPLVEGSDILDFSMAG
ncbi:hypothetical protein ES703_104529 [subsurface metagenome]